mmetsp:Transcript_13709/g.37011  ORF Transcript_13709/g.37011 Transcript_13709/m.37011 type:complete len:256 (+) Transcript_13709:1094-1861(+)
MLSLTLAGIWAPCACMSATDAETSQRTKLNSASPPSMSPSPGGTIGSAPRLSRRSCTRRGNFMYVAAHCLLPHPKTPKRAPSAAAWAPGVSSHSLKRRALSGGCPLYTLVTTMVAPSAPLGSWRPEASWSIGCFSTVMPMRWPVEAARSAKSSQVPMLEPKSTTSLFPLSSSTSRTSWACGGDATATANVDGGRSTPASRGTHLRRMPCGSRKSGTVTESFVAGSTRRWNLRHSVARHTRCSISESCCPMQARLP